MVEGRWPVEASSIVSEKQKQLILQQLSNRITADGFLLVKSQSERTQLGNKEEVIKKANELVSKALIPKKARIATKISKAAKDKILQNKKQKSSLKENRKKLRRGDY